MTPIAEFVLLRLGERRQELMLRSGDDSLREHYFASATVVALLELLPDHMGATGDGENAICSGCRRFYPCRPARVMAWLFHDHADYDEAWDPNA